MIARIKGAWHALKGSPVVMAEHRVIVCTDADGVPQVTLWGGLVAEDAAMALYRAADQIAAHLPHRSFKVH